MMEHRAKSIRPFLGARDFQVSCNFYKELGFEERSIDKKLSYFKTKQFGFYLQDFYIKDWVDNTMVFLEVHDVEQYWRDLVALNLPQRYGGVRTVPIQRHEWGKECFLHDPSGILWHFGEFNL